MEKMELGSNFILRFVSIGVLYSLKPFLLTIREALGTKGRLKKPPFEAVIGSLLPSWMVAPERGRFHQVTT